MVNAPNLSVNWLLIISFNFNMQYSKWRVGANWQQSRQWAHECRQNASIGLTMATSHGSPPKTKKDRCKCLEKGGPDGRQSWELAPKQWISKWLTMWRHPSKQGKIARWCYPAVGQWATAKQLRLPVKKNKQAQNWNQATKQTSKSAKGSKKQKFSGAIKLNSTHQTILPMIWPKTQCCQKNWDQGQSRLCKVCYWKLVGMTWKVKHPENVQVL